MVHKYEMQSQGLECSAYPELALEREARGKGVLPSLSPCLRGSRHHKAL